MIPTHKSPIQHLKTIYLKPYLDGLIDYYDNYSYQIGIQKPSSYWEPCAFKNHPAIGFPWLQLPFLPGSSHHPRGPRLVTDAVVTLVAADHRIHQRLATRKSHGKNIL